MADSQPTPPPRPAMASGSNVSQAGAVRNRPLQRQSTNRSPSASTRRSPPRTQRRSSVISYSSIEDATTSFADDFLSPTTSKRRSGDDESEVTHWHSTPLAFAILPAVGGLLFKNGSAFVTDLLLLGLAAVFMNWSIRIPWDWYYSAQLVQKKAEPDYFGDTISEEEEPSEAAIASSSEDVTKSETADGVTEGQHTPTSKSAAANLRRQELLALAATFIFPMLAACLLHVIRAQLSRPSTTLVSDYNLSIFILAAEVRPVRQLVRLMANRTLHLRRTATGLDDPSSIGMQDKSAINGLLSRVAELEARLSEHQVIPQTVSIAQKADVTDLSAEMRKRYEPRLEGLERAVRRYEKRFTTLTMLTEQRLNSLETRLQDALSLAAIAAQHSQKRGFFAYVLENTSKIVSIPLKVAWAISVWPFVLAEDLYTRVKTLMLGPIPQKSARRKHVGKEDSMDEKGKAKGFGKKVLR